MSSTGAITLSVLHLTNIEGLDGSSKFEFVKRSEPENGSREE